MDNTLPCPHCGHDVRVTSYSAGLSGPCPNCRHDMAAPMPEPDTGWRPPLLECAAYAVFTAILAVGYYTLLVKYPDHFPESVLSVTGPASGLRPLVFAGTVAYVVLGMFLVLIVQSAVRALAVLFVLFASAYPLIAGHIPLMGGPWWLFLFASPLAWVVALLWGVQFHLFRYDEPIQCRAVLRVKDVGGGWTAGVGGKYYRQLEYTYRDYEVDGKRRLFDLVGLILPLAFFTSFTPPERPPQPNEPPAQAARPAPAQPPPPAAPEGPPDWAAYYAMPNGTCRVALPRNSQVKTAALPARPSVVGAARMEGTVSVAGVAKPVLIGLTETLYDAQALRGMTADRMIAAEAKLEWEAIQGQNVTSPGRITHLAGATGYKYTGFAWKSYPFYARVVVSADRSRCYRFTAVLPPGVPVQDDRQLNAILDSFELVPPEAAKR
jgi:hypothetical protein